jgi:tRNA uridine 5-carboxymethylaminomethyl modification enzyme
VQQELERLRTINISAANGTAQILADFGLEPIQNGVNALQLLRRPEVNYEVIESLVPPPDPLPASVVEQVSIETKFEGYIIKQQQHVDRVQRLENKTIPLDFDYEGVTGLRHEARQKLLRFRPATVGQASRIAGVNPADISILLVYLERRRAGVKEIANGKE